MKIVTYLLVVALLLAIGTAVYARLAPVDPTRWHAPVTATADRDLPGGAVRVVAGDAARLAAVNAALLALPRTRVLAGSVAEGRITYITRSALFGFPDFTTVDFVDGELRLFARLRFGLSDLGVNRRRLEQVLARIQ